jgi:D-3-phosphoglycerate dehydrogenase
MPSTCRILVTAPYFLPVLEQYRTRLEAEGIELLPLPVPERAGEEELLAVIGDIDGVICGDDRFTERVVARAGRLKVISKWGTGVDSIDLEACARRGIAVYNTPDAFSIPVADTVVGYALAFLRRLPWMDREVKGGGWSKSGGTTLAECTFGIVGVGRIGRQVARRVASFGGRLLGNDIVPIPQEVLRETGLRSTALEELLAESDVVSLNCDLNPTSRGLINAGRLALMKPTAVLINTARGPVVEEAALIEALTSGRLGGAALDVFAEEPLPADSPLRRLDNVMLAPHNANASPTARTRVHENTVANLIRGLRSRD